MAVRVVDAPIKEFYGQEVAPKDNSDLTTDRRATNVPSGGWRELLINPVLACRIDLVPKVLFVYWYEAATDTWHNLIDERRSILDSLATGDATFTLAVADFLYVGCIDRFGGMVMDLASVNNNALHYLIYGISYVVF